VVHIPTSTTLYIEAARTEETRTIMRADLVAIHTALRSLHYTSLYRRLLVATKLKGTRLHTVGRAIHKKAQLHS